jgi:hypothetical protein
MTVNEYPINRINHHTDADFDPRMSYEEMSQQILRPNNGKVRK